MSFWPFPKRLLEQLQTASAHGACVDLGSGEGQFRQRLAQVGIETLALDIHLASLLADTGTRVCGRAECLPVRDSCLGLVCAANLWRHLSADQTQGVIREVQRALVPEGACLILEDAVVARSISEQNYRTCLDLLARVDPTRGSVCSLDPNLASPAMSLLDSGEFDNQTAIVDPGLPLRWLHGRVESRGWSNELEALEESVERHGMQVGNAQYQLWGMATR